MNFVCSAYAQATCPLVVSPDGERILLGGDRHTTLKLFDSSLKESKTLPQRLRNLVIPAIPGNQGFLIQTPSGVFIVNDGGSEVSLNLDPSSGWRSNRFLSDSVLAMLVGDRSQAVLVKLDGSELYRLSVPETWKAEFVVSEGGKRFGVSRYGNTRLDYLLNLFNLLDIDDTRRPNLQVLQVFDVASGKQVAASEWDPEAQYIVPAISPSGTRVATIRAGTLEVIQIP